jgi:hypothetical protein
MELAFRLQQGDHLIKVLAERVQAAIFGRHFQQLLPNLQVEARHLGD